MLVRHYNRNGAKQRKRRLHPDAELELNLAKRDAIQQQAREDATGTLQGIGIVSATRVLVTRPKHVRRNQGYIAGNGAWIATEPAPYGEFSRDVAMRRRASSTMPKQDKRGYSDAELALLEKMANLHKRRTALGTQKDYD